MNGVSMLSSLTISLDDINRFFSTHISRDVKIEKKGEKYLIKVVPRDQKQILYLAIEEIRFEDDKLKIDFSIK